MDVIDVALGQQGCTLRNPVLDLVQIPLGQLTLAIRLDFAVTNVDHGDLIHLNSPLPAFSVHAKHKSAVVTDAEIILR